jgi:hypothetical protein
MATKKKVNYKKKSIDLAKEIARSLGICEKCDNDTRQMHGSHILSVGAHPNMGAVVKNILCLCSVCHKLGGHSWHQEPVENAQWLEKTYPGLHQSLQEQSVANPNPDWEATYYDLKENKQKYIEQVRSKRLDIWSL